MHAGEGKCVHVPQAWDEKTQTRTCNAKRSAATAFPTTEKSGLLYVWMVPGGEAHLRAMQCAATCSLSWAHVTLASRALACA